MTKELIKISLRVDKQALEDLKKLTGLDDNSKAIRSSMNFTNNVGHRMFGGNIQHMFKRKKKDEEISLYDNNL